MSTSTTPSGAGGQNSNPDAAKLAIAAAIGLVVLVTMNFAVARFLAPMSIGSETLGGSEQAYDSFYDGCVALLTLAVPSFLGGLLMSRVVGTSASRASLIAFGIAAVIGLIHPFWQVPIVSAHSAHSPFMAYMLRSPLVILAFGTLGGWLGGEFASGRFTLADREPPYLPGLEED